MEAGSRVLEGVERIHWDSTSVLCFPGSVAAIMRYLGEDVSNDEVMGVSGGAFKLFWMLPWAPCNCDLLLYGDEPIRRTFNALGYEYTYLPDYERKMPTEFYRSRIVKSIDAGMPVIAMGVVGPPECCVVAGYEDGGNVLLGTSYFQENKDGYFRTDEWADNIHGLILIGGKHEKPAPRQALADTLEWAVKLARMPEFQSIVSHEGERRTVNGLAAYDVIARMLLKDEEFPAGEAEALLMRCIALGNDGIHLLYCKRGDAARFLESHMAPGAPGAKSMKEAARAYRAEVDVLEKAMNLTPLSFSPEEERQKLLARELREELAGWMCRAKALEEEAIEALEAALKEMR